MSARQKTPDADENKRTAIFDAGTHRRRVATPPEYGERDLPTVVDGPLAQAMLEEPASLPGAPTQHEARTLVDAPAPIQVISMKTPGQPAPPTTANPSTPMLPRPKLRALSEITPANQQNLGHVAPPYDPDEARARQLREYVIWGSVAVILASAIALVVWFVAR